MTDGFGPKEFPYLTDDVQSVLQNLGRLQRERTTLVGRSSVRRGRVTAAVNADGVLVDLKFGRNVEDLGYPELARVVIEAVQEATADVVRKSQELMAPLKEQKDRLPKLSDLVPGMPDLSDQMPKPQRAPLTKPSSEDDDESRSKTMTFDNVEVVEQHSSREPGVTDSGW
jgi:DNA-binding protein YbaB